jgi:hypothetical protein
MIHDLETGLRGNFVIRALRERQVHIHQTATSQAESMMMRSG